MIWVTVGCLVGVLATGGQEAASNSASILILGTFHMGAQADSLNPTVKDLLAARRQGEIRKVVEQLARFQPTKIALEALEDSAIVTDYERFVGDDFELKMDERHQIGFRLAKKMGHARVYAVDYHDPIDVNGLFAWAKENGQDDRAAHLMEAYLRITAQWNPQLLESRSVSSILELLNSPRTDAAIHRTFISGLRIGTRQKPIGADLVSMWYGRNIRIAANILRLADPGDRILVLFGANHRKLLTEFLEETTGVEVVNFATYLKGK